MRKWFIAGLVLLLSLIGLSYLGFKTFVFAPGQSVAIRSIRCDTSTFVGQTRNGQPDGIGVMTHADGSAEAGRWADGKKDGLVRTYANGKTSFALWRKGALAQTIHPIRSEHPYGIDVSAFQPEHWGAMLIRTTPDGSLTPTGESYRPVDFVIIKASGGDTDIDSRYHLHSAMASALGIPQGAYHFFTPLIDAQQQADVFLSQIADTPLAFPPILDVEGDWFQIPGVFRLIEPEIAKWLDYVRQKTGVRPLIYCNSNFYMSFGKSECFKSHDFWLAAYTETAPSGGVMWQCSDEGRLVDWNANVDIDILFQPNYIFLQQ